MDHLNQTDTCHIPSCAENAGTYLQVQTGWVLTGGLVQRPYICEAPIECVHGIGLDYNGTVSNAWTGEPCLNWLYRDITVHLTRLVFDQFLLQSCDKLFQELELHHLTTLIVATRTLTSTDCGVG